MQKMLLSLPFYLLPILLFLVLSTGLPRGEIIPAYAGPLFRLAVLPFENNSITDREALEPFKTGLADTLITDLSQIEALQVVERNKLDLVLRELELSQSECLDAATAQQIGKILGVQGILTGSFCAIGSMLRIDTRVIEVETGLILKAEEVSGPSESFFELEDEMVCKIAAALNIHLSARETRRIRASSATFPALLAYSRGLEYLRSENFPEAARAFKDALALDPGYTEAARMLRNIQKGN